MPIRPLPTLLVNQIAAGEVIERPASVVKELLENALDAGAQRVEVAIESGGRDLVRVADDGSGIPSDELPLAVAPHATSKIARADDLDAIATLGFRGEALASIASVSRLSILSRQSGEPEAALLELEAGEGQPPRPAARPRGTTVTVRNLFYNTPARRKFLRTDQTETGRVVDVVQTLAISHPSVAMRLVVDGRVRIDLPADQAPRRRAIDVLGADLADELLDLETSSDGLDLWGVLGRPGIARPTARHMRVYLNGRPINDRTVNHAVREAYRGLIAPDRHPTAVLMIGMDPAEVDVNVHPAKAEVRFRNQPRVHHAVRTAVREVLQQADLVPPLELPAAGGPPRQTEAKPFGAGSSWPGGSTAPPAPGGTGPRGFDYQEAARTLAGSTPQAVEAPAFAEFQAQTPTVPVRPVQEALQVHDRYLVTQDAEGLVIIDQHALHERVMFERLRERMTAGPLESQRLLMPTTVDLDATTLERLESLQPLLAKLGIEAEPIGPKAIAVHAFTSLLFERRVEPGPFMRELLGKADELCAADDPEAALHEVLDMMSCKAAIKSGDRLTPEEIADLVRHGLDVDRFSRCPHGRPTTLRLSLADLDRQFGR
ncbi:MAG: DNA mismatch repair endonuclease MutL [Planctomycetota bacterium]